MSKKGGKFLLMKRVSRRNQAAKILNQVGKRKEKGDVRLKKIAVVGSINIDQTITSERIPLKGETLPGRNLRYIPGGKGANQAVAMAKLGAQVEMFGCVGDDENGRKMIENLANNNVQTHNIKIVSDIPTGIAIITVGENDNTIIVLEGANGQVTRAYIDSIKDTLFTYDMVVLQHEIPLDTVHYIVELCAEHNIPTLLNPAPAAEVPMETIEKVTYLTPNEHEAVLIFGKDRSTEDLLKAYPEKLIITQGSRGVSVGLANGEVLNVPARKAEVVDTTGAGDTLNGAFCVKIIEGSSIAEALEYANAAASLSIGKFGAQSGMPTAEELAKALEETK